VSVDGAGIRFLVFFQCSGLLQHDVEALPYNKSVIIIIIGGAVLSPYVSVQVPRYLLVPGTAVTLAYCTNPDDR
jgi:hypothetical protein